MINKLLLVIIIIIMILILLYIIYTQVDLLRLFKPVIPSNNSSWIDEHNVYRALVSYPKLKWSDKLASQAKKYAKYLDSCPEKYAYIYDIPYISIHNKNNSSLAPVNVVKAWHDEKSKYKPENPSHTNYTRLIWKDAKNIGCSIYEDYAVCVYDIDKRNNFKDNVPE